MILRDKSIHNMIYDLIDFDRSEETSASKVIGQINPNSIDLTISRCIKRPIKRDNDIWTFGFSDHKEANSYAADCWVDNIAVSDILLYPGDVILGCTQEYIKMPTDICGQLFTKSTLGRMFINHMMAGVVDAGFEGKLTLELKNEGPHAIRIPVGARVVQLVLMRMNDRAAAPYNARPKSRYNGAVNVECAKMEQNHDQNRE